MVYSGYRDTLILIYMRCRRYREYMGYWESAAGILGILYRDTLYRYNNYRRYCDTLHTGIHDIQRTWDTGIRNTEIHDIAILV